MHCILEHNIWKLIFQKCITGLYAVIGYCNTHHIFHYLFLVDIVGSEAEVMQYASVSVLYYCSGIIFTLNYHVEVFVMRVFLCFRFQVKIVVDVSLKLLTV